MEYQVVWQGIIHDSQGYARASRGYILALDQLGIDVKVEPMNFGTPSAELKPEEVKRLRELTAKPLAEDKKKILVYHAQPYGLDPDTVRDKFDYIIFNTVWETDRIPDNWFPNINKADAVIIPSRHNYDALKNSGVTVPIYVAPYGIDTEAFNPNNPPLPFSNVQDKFTFLTVGTWQHRKGLDILLQAFWRAFTSADNTCLIMKTHWSQNPSKAQMREVLQILNNYKMQLGFSETAPLYATFSPFSDQHLKGLYTSADAYVLPTRGEGIGMPYMEALASGLPVIAPRWGGQADFLNDGNSYAVDYVIEPSTTRFGQALASPMEHIFTADMNWAESSVEHLALLMRYAYEHQEETKAKGSQGRTDMEAMSWESGALRIVERVEELINE